jgi:hypothetical protein
VAHAPLPPGDADARRHALRGGTGLPLPACGERVGVRGGLAASPESIAAHAPLPQKPGPAAQKRFGMAMLGGSAARSAIRVGAGLILLRCLRLGPPPPHPPDHR